MPAITITCHDCRTLFNFSESEQEFYANRNLSAPQRCHECRQKAKNKRIADRVSYKSNCAKCGANCEVPFKPRPVDEGGKPILCKDCFMAQRQTERA